MVCSTWPEKLLADLNMNLKCICQLIVKIRLNRHFNSIGYFRNKLKNSQNEKNLLQIIAVVFQKNFTVASHV